MVTDNIDHRIPAEVVERFGDHDLSEIFRAAVAPLDEVELYYPDWPKYHYMVASIRHVIFGFAIGRNTIAFRLDRHFQELALATGAMAYPACGEGWVSFMPGGGWPRIDFEFWALKAYTYAREIGE